MESEDMLSIARLERSYICKAKPHAITVSGGRLLVIQMAQQSLPSAETP